MASKKPLERKLTEAIHKDFLDLAIKYDVARPESFADEATVLAGQLQYDLRHALSDTDSEKLLAETRRL